MLEIKDLLQYDASLSECCFLQLAERTLITYDINVTPQNLSRKLNFFSCFM